MHFFVDERFLVQDGRLARALVLPCGDVGEMLVVALGFAVRRLKLLAEMGVRCLIYQPPYSILNRWPEAAGIFDWLLKEQIGCVVFSPLAQGMLTPKYLHGIPEGSRAAREEGFLQPEQVQAQQQKINALGALAQAAGWPLHHLALRWALRSPAVTSAIVGARTVAQLDDLLAALDAPPADDATLAAIDAISPAAGYDPHTKT